MIVVFLLCVIAGSPAAGQILDVCATCHTNATCDDKLDHPGKVCNCKYGFVGNGIHFCQDKDECQIGASKLCGQHTQCQNTFGSYYCTCGSGYSPTNNLAIFIPNDGTYCQDIDECRITGLCGEGGLCRNLDGSFECACQLGYQVHNGAEPFHPPRDKASCKVVDCGQPASVEDTVLLSVTGTTYGSVATYVCDEGFIWGSGDNTSVCGAGGLWGGPTVLCEVVDCGQPASVEDTVLLSVTGTTYGSVATYVCDEGFIWGSGDNTSVCGAGGLWGGPTVLCEVVDCGQPASVEDTVLLSVTGTTYGSVATYVCDEGFIWGSGDNTSVCGAGGLWGGPTVLCEEITCGPPPVLPHSHMLWNKSSKMGTEVVYQCNSGYDNVGKGNVSICTAAGQWEESPVLCQETLCGSPPISEYAELVWNGSTAPGSTVLYFCKKGFYNKGGHNVSVCNENGQWTPPALSCQEILCGDPPILPHTVQVRNGSSTPGSTVTYYCKIGFYHSKGNNVSLCTNNASWTKPNISCKDVQCGAPPPIPHSVMLWDKIPTVGSRVVYQCTSRYRSVGERNVSVCTPSGEWDEASLLCQEISCQEPISKPHSKVLWDGTLHTGSVAYFQCDEGYHTTSLKNYSVCGENGLWEDVDLWCEEINCGPPLILPHTNLLWDHTSRPGSVVLYECMDGYYLGSGNTISVCSLSGEWGEISLKCQAKCGPVPFLANSEVVWHNRSVVIHRCMDGYHSWKGSNISVCGSSGVWQKATLRCREIKPPINHLYVVNEKCMHWKAEKYEEDTEAYKVTYMGTRDYQRSFRDKRRQFLNSKADQMAVCLNLLPATNYSISITALSARFTATITTNTSLPVPAVPVVHFKEFETPVPTLRLHRSANTLDPISLYQVFVVPVGEIMVFDCSIPGRPHPNKFPWPYITAQILVRHVGTEINFTVGDGIHYGGFYNAPLENGRNYYIILRAVSQWKTASKSSCVLWAKIKGTSYVLRVSSLSAAASVGLVALAILGGYSCIGLFKKT